MFHVRRLITQTNLSLISKNTKQLKYLYSTQSIDNSNSLNNNTLNKQAASIESVSLSKSCIERLKDLRTQNQYLRILVESGGCSGLNYKFSLDSNITNEDIVVEKEGAKVLVDKETLEYIKGSVIDYYEELIRSGFRIINNPNSEHGCSCGSSFSIKI